MQAIEHTAAHVIDPRLHSAVKSCRMVPIIALGTMGMHLLISLFAISLLEQDISTDSRFF